MNSIIDSVFSLFGIVEPTTVAELMYDIIKLFVGMYVVKYAMIAFVSFFRDVKTIG